MIQLSSKKDDLSLCYDVIIMNPKKVLKIDKFDDFSSDIDFSNKKDIIRNVYSLINNQCEPRRPRAPPGDTKCPPAAQRKQAERACFYLYSDIFTPNLR